MFGRAGIITTMTFCIELALGVSIVGDCQNTVSFSILILIFSTDVLNEFNLARGGCVIFLKHIVMAMDYCNC